MDARMLSSRRHRAARRLASVLFLCLSGGSSALAQDAAERRVIEVGSPDFRPYPLAIPKVRATAAGPAAKAARTLTKVLRFDFDLSAQLELLDPASYLADPKKEGMTPPTIRFEDWINVGAEGLLKGVVRDEGGERVAELRFFDVTTGRPLLSKTYPVSPERARPVAHAFADALIETLTGVPGIFQTQIAVARKSREGRELWVMDVDGQNLRPVTQNGSLNLLPSWTSDGRSLIFTSYIKHNPNLYRVRLSNGRLSLLSAERGLNTGGAMSPDGQKIALTLSRDGNSEIYVMSADRTGLKRLTREWAIDSSPTWSPDGRRLAFVSSRFGDPHIFVMNADGSEPRRLTDKGNYNTTPDWSPRGDLIAFTARDERNVFDIFTVDVSTRVIRRLTQDQGNNEEPSFSPDGNHIVFTSTREGRSQVWVMAVDGTNQRRLTSKGGFATPAWSPTPKAGALQ
jgi:TolB protein